MIRHDDLEEARKICAIVEELLAKAPRRSRRRGRPSNIRGMARAMAGVIVIACRSGDLPRLRRTADGKLDGDLVKLIEQLDGRPVPSVEHHVRAARALALKLSSER